VSNREEGEEGGASVYTRTKPEPYTSTSLGGSWDNAVEMLDAIKNNTVVKRVSIYENSEIGRQLKLSQALVKLSEIMKCNKSVESLANFS
jgi:hypothetical protein